MDENPSQCPVCEGPMSNWQSAGATWKKVGYPMPLNKWSLVSFGPMMAPRVAKLIFGGEDDGVWRGVECWWDGEDKYWSLSSVEEYMVIPPRSKDEPIPSEPVAVLRYDRSPGNENEMPKVVSCNWLPDGEYEVFLRPQP